MQSLEIKYIIQTSKQVTTIQYICPTGSICLIYIIGMLLFVVPVIKIKCISCLQMFVWMKYIFTNL